MWHDWNASSAPSREMMAAGSRPARWPPMSSPMSRMTSRHCSSVSTNGWIHRFTAARPPADRQAADEAAAEPTGVMPPPWCSRASRLWSSRIRIGDERPCDQRCAWPRWSLSGIDTDRDDRAGTYFCPVPLIAFAFLARAENRACAASCTSKGSMSEKPQSPTLFGGSWPLNGAAILWQMSVIWSVMHTPKPSVLNASTPLPLDRAAPSTNLSRESRAVAVPSLAASETAAAAT